MSEFWPRSEELEREIARAKARVAYLRWLVDAKQKLAEFNPPRFWIHPPPKE